jgi:hypothetical protein
VNPPIKLCRRAMRLALTSAASLAVGLALPAYSSAAQTGTRSEERAVRAEERSTRREDERAIRAQEREAARSARGEAGSSETTSEAGAGQSTSEGGTPASTPTVSPAQIERECRVSIEASSTRIKAGEAVTLSGALECPVSANAADQQVPIYQRQGPGSFSLVGSATTEADGSFELTPAALSRNTVFQARVGRHRARVSVKVGPAVTLSILPGATQASAAASQPRAQAHTRTTFTGTVSPVVTGALVALQVAYGASGERWRSVAYGHVAADGSYSIAHSFKTPGLTSVRTLVHLGRHYAAAVSESLSYEVPQPQNPQLSIQASADPLVYGQSLTISGVAAGAAGQPVTLLARTAGGAFTEVAKTTTEADGDYSFMQMPLQSTYYRVSDAAAQSTALVEGVAFALTSTPPPTTAEAGQLVSFSGTLSPAPVGQVVYLEREYPSGVGFHVIGQTKVAANSEYLIEQAFDRATIVLRVRAPGDGQFLETTGAPFTLTVAG